RRSALLPLVAIVVRHPFLFAIPKSSWNTGEPRYGLFLAPVLALLLASAVTMALRRPSAQLAVFALLAASRVASLNGLMDYGERNPGHHDLTPNRLGPLADALEREGVRTVVADYWIAYARSFETPERITATPTATVRYRPYRDKVAAAGARNYVFFQGQPEGATLASAALSAGVRVRKLPVEGFDVFLFDRPVGVPPP